MKTIEPLAFEKCAALASFAWPRNDLVIPKGCFSGCSSLCDFRFEDPSHMKTIDQLAFENCVALASFVWPPGVPAIPKGCFSGCSSLRDFQFEDECCAMEIRANAFSSCTSLANLHVPGSVEIIGKNCFQACTSLQTVVLGGDTKLTKEDLMAAGLTADANVTFAGGQQPPPDKPPKVSPAAKKKDSKTSDAAKKKDSKAPDAAKKKDSKAPDAAKKKDSKAPDAAKKKDSKAPDAAKKKDSKAPDAAKTKDSKAPDAAKTKDSKAPDAAKTKDSKASDAAKTKDSKASDAATAKDPTNLPETQDLPPHPTSPSQKVNMQESVILVVQSPHLDDHNVRLGLAGIFETKHKLRLRMPSPNPIYNSWFFLPLPSHADQNSIISDINAYFQDQSLEEPSCSIVGAPVIDQAAYDSFQPHLFVMNLPSCQKDEISNLLASFGGVAGVSWVHEGFDMQLTFGSPVAVSWTRAVLPALKIPGAPGNLMVASDEREFPVVVVSDLPKDFTEDEFELFQMKAAPKKVVRTDIEFLLLFESDEEADSAVKAIRYAEIDHVAVMARRLVDPEKYRDMKKDCKLSIKNMAPETRAFDVAAWAEKAKLQEIYNVMLRANNEAVILFDTKQARDNAFAKLSQVPTSLTISK